MFRKTIPEMLEALRHLANTDEERDHLAVRTNHERLEAADQIEDDQHLIRQLRAEILRLKVELSSAQASAGHLLQQLSQADLDRFRLADMLNQSGIDLHHSEKGR